MQATTLTLGHKRECNWEPTTIWLWPLKATKVVEARTSPLAAAHPEVAGTIPEATPVVPTSGRALQDQWAAKTTDSRSSRARFPAAPD